MPEISLTVDGQSLSVPEQTTVLEALHRAGAEVPDLCNYPGRPTRAVCRLCLVEVEGLPGLITACSMSVREGIVINTKGDYVSRVRQNLLKLVLAEHGHCGRPSCEVEELASKFGVTETPFCCPSTAQLPRASSDYLRFHPDACAHCDRCIRACGERGVLGRSGRGASVCLAFGDGGSVDQSLCVSCGDCVAACPSGSLVGLSQWPQT